MISAGYNPCRVRCPQRINLAAAKAVSAGDSGRYSSLL